MSINERHCTHVCYSCVCVCVCARARTRVCVCVCSVPQRAVAAAVVRKPEHYLPTVLEEGADELEHYKLQVKIMADIVNVSHCHNSDVHTSCACNSCICQNLSFWPKTMNYNQAF